MSYAMVHKRIPEHLPSTTRISQPSAQAGSAHEINSAITDRLSTLHSRPISLTNEIGDKIRERCGISASRIKVFRDDGLKEFGQTAYAKGNEIHLAGNDLSMNSDMGQKVIMHETAHIVQQGTSHVDGALNENPALEAQADHVSEGGHINGSGFATPSAEGAAVQGYDKWDTIKKKLGSAKDFIGDKIVGAYDTARNLGDDFHDWKKDKKAKIKDAYHNSFLETGVNNVKEAGSWIGNKVKTGAKWAGKQIADGAKFVGRNVADGAKKVAKSQFGQNIASAGRTIGKNIKDAGRSIKESDFGQGVASAAKTVGSNVKRGAQAIADSSVGKAVASAGRSVIDTGHNVVKKYKDTKESIKNWGEDKMQALREHDDDRYMKHRAQKKGAKYLNDWASALDDSKKGAIGENIAARGNVDHLSDYDEGSRKYIENKPEEVASPPSSLEKAKEIHSGGEEIHDDIEKLEALKNKPGDVKEYIGNVKNLVQNKVPGGESSGSDGGSFLDKAKARGGQAIATATGIHETGESAYKTYKNLKAGNYQKGVLSGADTIDNALGTASNVVDSTGLNVATNATGVFTNTARAAVHGKQLHDVNKLTQDDLHNGIQSEREKHMMSGAKISASGKLKRDVVGDVSNAIQSGVSLGGNIADLSGAGGAGALASGLVNAPIAIGTSIAKSRMKSKNNRQIMKQDIFGSEENYKKFKHDHGLSKRDMDILIRKRTGARTVNDIAERAKLEQAQVIHKNIGNDTDTGADTLMSKVGEQNKQTRKDMEMDDVREHLDQTQSLKNMKRRRVAKTW